MLWKLYFYLSTYPYIDIYMCVCIYYKTEVPIFIFQWMEYDLYVGQK